MDKTMDLRPPIRRSWLRLRLGKAYYTGKRYLLWCSPSTVGQRFGGKSGSPASSSPTPRPFCGISGGRKWSGRRIR